MAVSFGALWDCDIKGCKEAIHVPEQTSPATPEGWSIHEVDGQPIVCCPKHHKAFVSLQRNFIQGISIDMQALIDAYERMY